MYKPLHLLLILWAALSATPSAAQEKSIVGLIPKATKPIKMDGKLDEWDGAFVTPVHVGHPDFANRGAQFLFLWDEQNLYVGLRCLDQKPAHIGADNQIWNGDAVEFYLDTRRGDKLGAAQFGPGTLHSFWTPFTKTELKPRHQVRDLPAFKGLQLKGDEVIGAKTPWGYTAEFKLPWANFPDFTPRESEVIGLDCELCSSDGGPRVDRTFVYSSPAAVSTPSAFGRVQLVEKIDREAMKPLGRALLPLSLTKSANYAWMYATVCVSPTVSAAKLEGKILDAAGKVKKATIGGRKILGESGFDMWNGNWELFDLPPGTYTLELAATDKDGKLIVSRRERFLHGDAAPGAAPKGAAKQIPSTLDPLPLVPRATESDANGSVWSPRAAAKYLDERAEWWLQWSGSARGQGTACLSCHSSVPFALARPSLGRHLGETTASAMEQLLIANVKKRVDHWEQIAADAASSNDPFIPFYRNNRKPSALGTESVLNALVLVNHDVRRANGNLGKHTRKALSQLWAQQQEDGAWLWLEFGLRPWEKDAAYFGAALAAMAVGTAGKEYYGQPELQTQVSALKKHLKAGFSSQPLHHRVLGLWASARLPGVLDDQDQRQLIEELRQVQETDGGWSLAKLGRHAKEGGEWKSQGRHPEGTRSDGYATGLVVLALKGAGLANDQEMLKKSTAWLVTQQRDGTWPVNYPNKMRDPQDNIGKFMRDAATAFAALALTEPR